MREGLPTRNGKLWVVTANPTKFNNHHLQMVAFSWRFPAAAHPLKRCPDRLMTPCAFMRPLRSPSAAAPRCLRNVIHKLLERGDESWYTVLKNESFLVKGCLMATTRIEIDHELARMIMLRYEELYDGETPSETGHFCFEGYAPENISYNIKKLANAKLITARSSTDWHAEKLGIRPTGITEQGWRFLEAAKDENRWTEALETVKQQGGAVTFGPLKAALFAGTS